MKEKVMLMGIGDPVVGTMTKVTYTPELTRKIICNINLTTHSEKWLKNNLNETIKIDCDKFSDADCLITNRKTVGDKIVLRMES